MGYGVSYISMSCFCCDWIILYLSNHQFILTILGCPKPLVKHYRHGLTLIPVWINNRITSNLMPSLGWNCFFIPKIQRLHLRNFHPILKYIISWQPSWLASISPTGLTLQVNRLEHWLATLIVESTQVRMPEGLLVPGRYNIIETSNGSWCMGIKGEMSATVCDTFTWDMYIYMSCL